ncbi:MAG: hypothetical protein QOJ27_1206 [Sphingomonadales bacterium]|nr:hypothetical protein [Sphingomonadales bacterium]
MRRLAALLLLVIPAPALAQAPLGILDALRRDFPLDHAALSAGLVGKPPQEERRLAYAGIDRFLHAHRDSILAAPGPDLVAIEARQGALLRALETRDVRLCAVVGDRGLFSPEALAGPAPPGLDEYGAALVAAAKAGAGASAATAPASREDVPAWLAAVAKIEPAVPVRTMLSDRQARAASSSGNLCRGAAAMHEAAVSLPAGQRERLARTLLRSVIGSAAE